MKIVILDSATLGDDIDTSIFAPLGELFVYDMTRSEELAERTADADIIIVNKVKFGEKELRGAKKLKLICETATGYDNIDIDACGRLGIAVSNVEAYSTDSVAQVTMSLALSLLVHVAEYDRYTKSGAYIKSGMHNCLVPVFHELAGKTWGIVGLGNIGKKVAHIAQAFGCRIIAYKRTPEPGYECVGIDELCARSDVISIHTPLNDGTRGLFSAEKFALMKPDTVVVNTARGAVVDSEAVTEAVLSGRIAGYATDVYSSEPLAADSPLCALLDCDRAVLTPHMAWGAYEARVRCMEEVKKNIEAYLGGEKRNRIV